MTGPTDPADDYLSLQKALTHLMTLPIPERLRLIADAIERAGVPVPPHAVPPPVSATVKCNMCRETTSLPASFGTEIAGINSKLAHAGWGVEYRGRAHICPSCRVYIHDLGAP